LTDPHDVVAQIAFAFRAASATALAAAKVASIPGGKNVEMQLHVDGIASRRRLGRSHRDDVIVTPVVRSAAHGLELVAQFGAVGGLVVGVVGSLVFPGVIDHEPVGPIGLLENRDAHVSGLLERPFAVLLE